ncbi:hypothetical protein E2C01_031009 [Portunus trituberculatus]|uniref:Uncharacterized protein n=1 Tax=Portunus trituberculatus TaxID=210409 RepID=A0A5B7EWG4_PORTR|nr:hypothetical protein [Portunus trituberculatus]
MRPVTLNSISAITGSPLLPSLLGSEDPHRAGSAGHSPERLGQPSPVRSPAPPPPSLPVKYKLGHYTELQTNPGNAVSNIQTGCGVGVVVGGWGVVSMGATLADSWATRRSSSCCRCRCSSMDTRKAWPVGE